MECATVYQDPNTHVVVSVEETALLAEVSVLSAVRSTLEAIALSVRVQREA